MIRLLHHEQDKDILEMAWNWRYSAPTWFQESLEIFKESKDSYLEAARNELHYGVFTDEPVAVIRLVELLPYVLNIHLSVKRKTDPELLLRSGIAVRDHLFKQGVKGFTGWLPSVNKGVAQLYLNLGFSDVGSRCYKGTIRGRLAEFRQYAILNPKSIVKQSKIE